MIITEQKVKIKWNNANRNYYESYGYRFTKNGEEFEIDINHITKSSDAIVKFKCDWCSETFNGSYKIRINTKTGKHFCCHDCSVKYNSKIKLEARPWIICEWCGEGFQVSHTRKNTAKFCCRECQGKWQSENRNGANHPNYIEKVIVKCDWCNEDIERTPNRLEKQNHNFCNYECARNWHREVLIQTDEFKNRMKEVMIANLTEGKISTTLSKPQVIINKLLDDKQIHYKNEVPFGEYSIDIQLKNSELLVEINGSYFHCDNRIYDEINYEIQLKRIKRDKMKKTYFDKNLNKKILYLWEFDVLTNLELCYKLILKYIENNGNLQNRHSFNYHIDDSGNIQLNNEEIIPYMEWNKKDLAKITDLSVREKVNKYNPEKNVTFNCEYCGEEATRNKIEYEDHTHHYCSVECRQKATGRHDYNCDNCGKSMKVKNYIFKQLKEGKRNSITCSRKCRGEFQRKITYKN